MIPEATPYNSIDLWVYYRILRKAMQWKNSFPASYLSWLIYWEHKAGLDDHYWSVITFWVTFSLVLHTNSNLLLSTTRNFNCSMKGKSDILSCKRYYRYRLWPVMTAQELHVYKWRIFGITTWYVVSERCDSCMYCEQL